MNWAERTTVLALALTLSACASTPVEVDRGAASVDADARDQRLQDLRVAGTAPLAGIDRQRYMDVLEARLRVSLGDRVEVVRVADELVLALAELDPSLLATLVPVLVRHDRVLVEMAGPTAAADALRGAGLDPGRLLERAGDGGAVELVLVPVPPG